MKIAVWGGQIFDANLNEGLHTLIEKITAREKKAEFYFFEDNRFDDAVLDVIKSMNPKFKAIFVTREKKTHDFKSGKKELLSHGYDRVVLYKCENNSQNWLKPQHLRNRLIRWTLNECDAALYYFYPEVDFGRLRTLLKPKRARLRLFPLLFDETRANLETAKASLTEEEAHVMEKVLAGAAFAVVGMTQSSRCFFIKRRLLLYL